MKESVEGDAVARVEDLNDEEGNDEQAQQGEQVGRGAKLSEEIHPSRQ